MIMIENVSRRFIPFLVRVDANNRCIGMQTSSGTDTAQKKDCLLVQ